MDCAATPGLPVAVTQAWTCVVTPSPLLTPSGWWITPIVGLVAAMLAAVMAWQNIENARDIARRKATIDLIEKAESSDHYRALSEAFKTVRKSHGFDALVDPTAPEEKKLRGQVIDYLNHYELVAIGVRNSVLDADIYRLWMLGAFIRDWNAAAGWIQAMRWSQPEAADRQYNPRIYANFEWAALRWSPNAVALTAATPPPLTQRPAESLET